MNQKEVVTTKPNQNCLKNQYLQNFNEKTLKHNIKSISSLHQNVSQVQMLINQNNQNQDSKIYDQTEELNLLMTKKHSNVLNENGETIAYQNNSILNQFQEKILSLTNNQNQLKQVKINRLSILDECVDKNYLESPRRIKKLLELQQKQMNGSKNPQKQTQPQQCSYYNAKNKMQTNQIRLIAVKQQKTVLAKQQKTVLVKQQKRVQVKQQKRVQVKQVSISPRRQDIISRKIPQTLLQSYTQQNLSITDISSSEKRKQRSKKILAKKSPQKLASQSQQITQSKIFQQLPIVKGQCLMKFNQNQQIKTKYLIEKNLLKFQNRFIFFIQNVRKIKFLKKNQIMTIKITYSFSQTQSIVDIIVVTGLTDQVDWNLLFQLFSSIFLRKILLRNLVINQLVDIQPKNITKKKFQQYEAQLLKKGQFFNTWQRKKLILTSQMLKGFKNNKCTDQITDIKQLWTRFDMINGYVVIKLWHGLEKVHLGLPLCDFTNIQGQNNWLYGLSSLIAQNHSK